MRYERRVFMLKPGGMVAGEVGGDEMTSVSVLASVVLVLLDMLDMAVD